LWRDKSGATKVARLKQTVFQERRFSASEWRTLLSSGSSSSSTAFEEEFALPVLFRKNSHNKKIKHKF
jgi:hypothetical protein